MITPVILAGGSGTRLWPLSRQQYPKQFLALEGERSLLQQTLARLDGLASTAPIVVGHEDHRFLVAEQLRREGVQAASLLLEPEGRNTAPAIALAALAACRDGHDPLLLVLPADHRIEDVATFHQAVHRARELAEQGYLVTFGVVPTHAETGYGYIQRGTPLGSQGFTVSRFVEKPAEATARHYVDSGEYDWNSGMFLFRASRYLAELEWWQPAMAHACQAAFLGAKPDLDFLRPDAETFLSCDNLSVDVAVMEWTAHAAVVPLEAGWSDIGSWLAVWESGAADQHGNRIRGDVMVESSHDLLVHADHRLVAALGVSDLTIIETGDAVLIADRHRSQEVKTLVARLEAEGREEAALHPRVHRPWGSYEIIARGPGYQVKRIQVAPGAGVSLQRHHQRAEHWVVVSGRAWVTLDERQFPLNANQSTDIPVGVAHRLENPDNVVLELIEVQSGDYLGEDDIERLEDRYGRS
ncbi:mannose-1-phosphate guanylyltransferase/mannose-6-phosphate isomerase [Aidingimonas halophila]|uniref:mannose-1-phosphate guanylyltransferase n=1 Tax=Aidingimonas halophila TaxID=574349 RepID=A0A1H3EDU3_9GAMM|nr:mannose-1-phosphate guanylyltransferase/mannose-6-phosphate isomerase [Aidingimonas halophila]GHC33747.1 xanthan biosynthesis protein XanB [Aidingimonas halophila]SDX76089.1 mannose-1-phosphate guanylyltransferase [Aidingimonas halophila]